jgi:hypothetical protein
MFARLTYVRLHLRMYHETMKVNNASVKSVCLHRVQSVVSMLMTSAVDNSVVHDESPEFVESSNKSHAVKTRKKPI